MEGIRGKSVDQMAMRQRPACRLQICFGGNRTGVVGHADMRNACGISHSRSKSDDPYAEGSACQSFRGVTLAPGADDEGIGQSGDVEDFARLCLSELWPEGEIAPSKQTISPPQRLSRGTKPAWPPEV